jgi:hypothetical protein
MSALSKLPTGAASSCCWGNTEYLNIILQLVRESITYYLLVLSKSLVLKKKKKLSNSQVGREIFFTFFEFPFFWLFEILGQKFYIYPFFKHLLCKDSVYISFAQLSVAFFVLSLWLC